MKDREENVMRNLGFAVAFAIAAGSGSAQKRDRAIVHPKEPRSNSPRKTGIGPAPDPA